MDPARAAKNRAVSGEQEKGLRCVSLRELNALLVKVMEEFRCDSSMKITQELAVNISLRKNGKTMKCLAFSWAQTVADTLEMRRNMKRFLFSSIPCWDTRYVFPAAQGLVRKDGFPKAWLFPVLYWL